MPGITTVESSGFIPEIWLGTALGRLKNFLTLQKTVTMDTSLPTGETFDVGRTLHLPKRGTLTVNDKTETGNFTVQNPQSSTVDLVLNRHKEVSFSLTSEVIAFQNQPQGIGYVEDGIIALAEAIDTDLFNVRNLIASANTITNASTITEANILSARKILSDNKAGANTRRYGVVSTSQEAAIFQLPNLVRYDAIGLAGNVANATVGNGIIAMPGAIGKVYDFEICASQLVPNIQTNDNTLQSITISGSPTGGTFTLTVGGQTTTPLNYNATALQVQTALAALSSVGAGNVYVTGATGGVWTVAFLANAAAITHTDSFTGGSSPGITVAQVAQTTGAKNLFYTQDFILMATRALPLPAPGQGAVGTVMTDPDTGLTMRLVQSWNPLNGSQLLTLDILYGFTAMRPEHGVLLQTN